MRWIWGTMIAIGVVASGCGSDKATCKKLLHRGVECQGGVAGQSDAIKAAAMNAADGMIDEFCDDGEVASEASKLSSCLDESSCDAFDACLGKGGGGGHGLLPGL